MATKFTCIMEFYEDINNNDMQIYKITSTQKKKT